MFLSNRWRNKPKLRQILMMLTRRFSGFGFVPVEGFFFDGPVQDRGDNAQNDSAPPYDVIRAVQVSKPPP